MLTLLLFAAVFCTLWVFVISLHAASLERLGSGRSLEWIIKAPQRFHYQLLHQLLFKEPCFDSFLIAAKICATISRLLLGAVVCAILLSYSQTVWIVGGVIALLLILLIAEGIPLVLAKVNAAKAFDFTVPMAACFLWLCFPLSACYIKWIASIFKRIESRRDYDPIDTMKETILHILLDANVKGSLSPFDKKLIDSVIKFRDRIVREVMVPRIDLFSLPIETTINQAAQHFLDQGYSRIPIYQDSVDNIIGVLMFKDFLKLYMDVLEQKSPPAFLQESVKSLMKSVLYTPETKKLSHLLLEFRNKQVHLAIVVDEYGGTEGVVTIEDLLEEIVGDIADEYDSNEEALYTSAVDGMGWIVDARMNLLDAEEAFHIRIPQEGDYDTIGGYVFHQAGSIPQQGLVIHHNDFTLEILSTTDRHVEKVKIVPRIKEKG